jgi:hypothetical protein
MTANSHHVLGESCLMRQDWESAHTLFARAVELLPDGSLTAYLSEGEEQNGHSENEMDVAVTLPALTVRYRLVLVHLWQRVKQHAHVFDEAYRALPLVPLEEGGTRALLFANIFSSAVLSEQYEEAYLVLVSLQDIDEYAFGFVFVLLSYYYFITFLFHSSFRFVSHLQASCLPASSAGGPVLEALPRSASVPALCRPAP